MARKVRAHYVRAPGRMPEVFGPNVLFKYKEAPLCRFVLNEILNMYVTVPQDKWTTRIMVPKNDDGVELFHLTFRLRLTKTYKEARYTAIYCGGKE
ncbi:hypothetical protein NPIL_294681 [Nephila pilipes]|uniref:Uncharacterized protein n=1 Tax=Nephila pilipes TaxID=299642 RepID=A0A8X6TV40_NEPPI|nr:hypothetical protein NPIL_294681 [Nephila pilipes]